MIDVFVPGRLRNPLNGSWGGWPKHARLARDWRERAATHLLFGMAGLRIDPAAPKVVTFTANVGARWDDDNLPAAIKPLRDALRDMKIVNDDSPDLGHTFRYAQRIDRKNPGVRIHVASALGVTPEA